MLHKNTLLCAGLGAVFLFAQVPLASAAVVTSMKPLGFIAAAIADGVTETQVLLPDGASEHDYSLRPSDVKRLQNADLVVWIGPEMEAFMDKSTQSIAANKKVTIAELDGVKPLLITGADDDDDHHGHDHGAAEKGDGDHHHGIYNMHLWLSPEIARLSAVAIHDKLLELMPQSRAKLDSNLQQFETALAATDKQVSNELAPLKGKGYFVFHDAYGYFEKHYGLTSLGTLPSTLKYSPVRSVYTKSEHNWLSRKPLAFLLSHSSGQRLSKLLPGARLCAWGPWIHWGQELRWVKRVTRNSSPNWRISIRAA